jgi:hypothetical protein
MFTALLDTCVLWPSLQRDFLLSLAIERMYRPIWSAAILEELEYHDAAKLTKRGSERADAEERARRLIRQIRSAFDDAEIVGWEPLEGTFGLPDEDDEHVLAAAVIGGAGAIVTHNLKDFPQELLPIGLVAVGPAEFAANTVAVDPGRALLAISAIAGRSGRSGPRQTPDQIMEVLVARYGMTEAVESMRRAR